MRQLGGGVGDVFSILLMNLGLRKACSQKERAFCFGWKRNSIHEVRERVKWVDLGLEASRDIKRWGALKWGAKLHLNQRPLNTFRK